MNKEKAAMNQMVRRSEAIQELGRPISYYPALAKIIGVEECVFFCQLMYWCTDGKSKDPEGWIYKSSTEWEEETGLSYKRQLTARKRLRTFGIVEEREEKLKHLLYFRINWRRYDDMLERMHVGNSAECRTGIPGNAETGFRGMPNRNSGECRNGIPGNAETGFRGMPKRDSVSTEITTEITAESTTERPNPKPLSKERGFPFSNSRDRTDWRALAFQDPGAKVVMALFPGETDWPEKTARLFVKRRQEGALSDSVLNLVSRYYRRTNDTDAKKPWKARTLREFLSTAKLDGMLPPLRRRVADDIQALETERQMWYDDEHTMALIQNIFEKRRKDPQGFPFELWLRTDPAIAVMACRGTPEAAKALVENRQEIENQLVYHRSILEFYRKNAKKLPPFEELFGIPEAEIEQKQHDYKTSLETQIAELKEL